MAKNNPLLAQKNQTRQQEWDDILIHEFDDLNEIDENMDLKEHTQLSFGARFENKISKRHIVSTGIYKSGDTVLGFKCGVCLHKWEAKASKVIRYGCPTCYAIDRNIQKARDIWLRSKQIIADKHGKIVKIPKQALDHVTKLTDTFGLKCGDCHQLFTFTHKRLRDNQWCPHCAQLGFERPTRVSGAVYKKGQSDEEKFARITQIAEIKGMAMTSKKLQARYSLACHKCGQTSTLTARQLCENKYPCFNRCIATHKVKL